MSAEITFMFRSMRAADDLVVKAMGVAPLVHAHHVDITLGQYLLTQWRAYARRAVRNAVARHQRGPEAVSDALDSSMGHYAGAVLPQVHADIARAYQLGGQYMAQRTTGRLRSRIIKAVDLTGSLDLEDQVSIRALRRTMGFWVGDHYTKNLSAMLRRVTREIMLEGGGSQADAAAALANELARRFRYIQTPTGWHGTDKAYFEGLAANIATTARSHGQLRVLRESMVEDYTWVAVADDRMCEICGWMERYFV